MLDTLSCIETSEPFWVKTYPKIKSSGEQREECWNGNNLTVEELANSNYLLILVRLY